MNPFSEYSQSAAELITIAPWVSACVTIALVLMSTQRLITYNGLSATEENGAPQTPRNAAISLFWGKNWGKINIWAVPMSILGHLAVL